MSTLIAHIPVAGSRVEPHVTSERSAVLSLVALIVVGLVAIATVIIGVVFEMPAIVIAAGFAGAFGMLGLVWRGLLVVEEK